MTRHRGPFAQIGALLRVTAVVCAVIAVYPAGSMVLARLGLIEKPEQRGLAIGSARATDGARAGVVLDEAHRGLTFDREVLLDLGRTAAADAAERLGLPPSTEWRVNVLDETRMPAGTRLLTADEVRSECPGRSTCSTALRLWMVAAFTTDGTAEVSVSYGRGHTSRPQKGWAQPFAREGAQWLRTERAAR